jgi:hypothetical protein
MSQVDNASLARTIKPNPIDTVKQQRIEYVNNFSKRLRLQLQSFVEDESFTEFEFEPMEKDDRYVV